MARKAIISTHDGREATIVTKASNVLFEDGQTAQDILNDRQDTMITPIITTSASMFKVGQGDNVDYSENVVDGAYESCVLKGNTKVNLIQESSSQDVILPYEFTEGQSVKVGDTKTSGKLGIMLKGQSLVNMVSNGYTQYEVGTSGLTLAKYTVKKEFIKPNTKYTLIFNVVSYSGGKISVTFNGSSSIYNANRNGLHKCTVTFTSEQLSALNGQVWFYKNTGETLGGKVQNIMFIEGDYTTKQVPYFDNIQSSKPTVVKTTGKNLFDINNSNHLGASNVITVSENKILGLHTSHPAFGIDNLDPTKTYTISFKMKVVTEGAGNSLAYSIASSKSLYPTDVKSTIYLRGSFTVGQEYKRTETFSGCTSLWLQQGYNIEYYDIQIEEGGSATTYESYTTSRFTLPEEVVLRGIPGTDICDTLNLETGEYTQNVQEFILTGSESYADLTTGTWTDDYRAFLINIQNSPFNFQQYPKQALASTKCYVEGFNYDTQVTHAVNKEGVCIGNGSDPNYIGFRIKRSRLEKYNNSPREWVKANNIRILLNIHPVTKKIDLSHSLETWDGLTHLDTEVKSGTIYPILSSTNPSYPVILKPSTKYSIVANAYSNNHTNSAINFNLGGATASTTVGNRVSTVTTPSTLTSEKLTMSGRGNKLNNVMVIEGDVVGDEPYFEGMCDVKSYKTLENLATSFTPTVYPYNSNIYHVDFNGKERLVSGKTYTMWSRIGGTVQLEIGSNLITINSSTTKVKFTVNGNIERFRFYRTSYDTIFSEQGVTGLLKDLIIVEGDYTNLDIPYFEGTVNFQRPMVTNVGKNLFDNSKGYTKGYCTNEGSHVSTEKELYSNDYTIIPSNTKLYTNGVNIYYYDNNKKWLGRASQLGYISPSNAKFARVQSKGITDGDFEGVIKTLWLSTSESDKYEPYKSNILSCNSEVILRSLPNGVCDTLDLMTGEYVQRIGEVVLDGSDDEEWWIDTGGSKGYTRFALKRGDRPSPISNVHLNKFICDKIKTVSVISGEVSTEVCLVETYANYLVSIVISNEKLGAVLVDNFKQYLSQNPITVQYQLATPITTTVDLQGSPFSYENGHVQLSSGSIEQSLTPKVEYSVATNRNGQIRSNQKMVEKHQKELDKLQAVILANLINSQYNQTLTTLKYELSRV